jgi:hypothetical protein
MSASDQFKITKHLSLCPPTRIERSRHHPQKHIVLTQNQYIEYRMHHHVNEEMNASYSDTSSMKTNKSWSSYSTPTSTSSNHSKSLYQRLFTKIKHQSKRKEFQLLNPKKRSCCVSLPPSAPEVFIASHAARQKAKQLKPSPVFPNVHVDMLLEAWENVVTRIRSAKYVITLSVS